jgi:hypothetical protein
MLPCNPIGDEIQPGIRHGTLSLINNQDVTPPFTLKVLLKLPINRSGFKMSDCVRELPQIAGFRIRSYPYYGAQKAQTDEKAQHTWKYVSILKRSATQLSGVRWGFEITSSL